MEKKMVKYSVGNSGYYDSAQEAIAGHTFIRAEAVDSDECWREADTARYSWEEIFEAAKNAKTKEDEEKYWAILIRIMECQEWDWDEDEGWRLPDYYSVCSVCKTYFEDDTPDECEIIGYIVFH